MRTNPDTSADTLPPLGSPIKPAATPAPAPQKTGTPGVLQGPDGKLHTDLPEPSWAAPSCVAEKPAEPAPEPAALQCRACGGQAMLCNGVAICRRLDCRG